MRSCEDCLSARSLCASSAAASRFSRVGCESKSAIIRHPPISRRQASGPEDLHHACPGGLMPSLPARFAMSSNPSSLHAVATPGVAPVTASHSPGAPGVGGGAPALPSSISLKASAQLVAWLTASTCCASSSTKQRPQKMQTLQRVPRRRSLIACSPLPAPQRALEPLAGVGSTELTYGLRESYRTGLSSAGSPGAVLPPGLMKNARMSATTESGMTVTHAVPTQPRPASRHAP